VLVDGWEDNLLRIAGDVEDARAELDDLLEERAEAAQDALNEGATYAEVAEALGVTRQAVQKMLAPPPLTDKGH
jgi:DNA-directed RNA polymerase specialized sigma24 family protein